MSDGKSPHHLIDLDPGIVADIGISHEDHKSIYSAGADPPLEDPVSPLNKLSPSFAKTRKQFCAGLGLDI